MGNDPYLTAEFHQWLTNIKEVADLFDAWKAALVAARIGELQCKLDIADRLGDNLIRKTLEQQTHIAHLEAGIKEIAAGFVPDGQYCGRPIYEIAPQCFPSSGEVGK